MPFRLVQSQRWLFVGCFISLVCISAVTLAKTGTRPFDFTATCRAPAVCKTALFRQGQCVARYLSKASCARSICSDRTNDATFCVVWSMLHVFLKIYTLFHRMFEHSLRHEHVQPQTHTKTRATGPSLYMNGLAMMEHYDVVLLMPFDWSRRLVSVDCICTQGETEDSLDWLWDSVMRYTCVSSSVCLHTNFIGASIWISF